MKKIINDPTVVVDEMLDGLAYIHSDLVYRVEGFDIIARKSEKTGTVGLISGGGSGHEPSHAGFVGEGMLSAAICGAVFTSPTPDQVLQAIKEADEGAGVFMVIKNYSGDIMNFEMAQEMAEMEGIEVASVVVDDDIAVEDSLYTQGRRGVAGTILVHKILGDAARAGKSLTEIKALADELVKKIHTVGLALSGATVPEVGKPGFVLADDEIEFGIGIHGEPGYRKEKMQPSKDLAKELVSDLYRAGPARLADSSQQSCHDSRLVRRCLWTQQEQKNGCSCLTKRSRIRKTICLISTLPSEMAIMVPIWSGEWRQQ